LSSARVAGMPLEDFCTQQGLLYDETALKAIAKDTRTAGDDTLHGKGGTCYGIATALARIVCAILGDQNAVLTVSSLAPASLGLGEVCLSLPATINRYGVVRVFDIPLNEHEQQALRVSAEVLKRHVYSNGYPSSNGLNPLAVWDDLAVQDLRGERVVVMAQKPI
jgi:L-lactate dehydrogenase